MSSTTCPTCDSSRYMASGFGSTWRLWPRASLPSRTLKASEGARTPSSTACRSMRRSSPRPGSRPRRLCERQHFLRYRAWCATRLLTTDTPSRLPNRWCATIFQTFGQSNCPTALVFHRRHQGSCRCSGACSLSGLYIWSASGGLSATRESSPASNRRRCSKASPSSAALVCRPSRRTPPSCPASRASALALRSLSKPPAPGSSLHSWRVSATSPSAPLPT
mmetsp:Transcript_44882/g.138468  ORF Transcript_44882/g.138468 Transcript_44882/m.138468 type:complete len:221 (-) Transcript_44882:395-1057(-)